ncbi:MAG TPA: DUF3616 domain-containing protein [Blastocatellia bacterium]|nr:DUF3616 domain-containing protein [Blastocatellia bacterium]
MSYRMRAFVSVAGILLIIIGAAIVGLLLFSSGPNSSATTGEAAVRTAETFSGGTFEASGVAYVRGMDAVLFVDDGKPGEVHWMQLDRDGRQAGAIKALKLGVLIEDLEGITSDGSHFYVVNSQSKPKSAGQIGLARFKLNGETQSIGDVQTLSELKRFLVENVADLREVGSKKAKDDGINIEGLSWDPAQGRLLIGLRSPVVGGNALVVPLKLRDPRGPFSFENMETQGLAAIRLPLGGMGIRSIEYDERQKVFHIIAGATESQDKTDFKLWEWGGESNKSSLREVTTFDRNLKPEGVTPASVGDSSFKFVVFDSSRYLKMQ